MEPISIIAWAVVVLVAGVWTYFQIERWWAEYRIRQIRDEVVEIARSIGIPESELGCEHGVPIGDECKICDRI